MKQDTILRLCVVHGIPWGGPNFIFHLLLLYKNSYYPRCLKIIRTLNTSKRAQMCLLVNLSTSMHFIKGAISKASSNQALKILMFLLLIIQLVLSRQQNYEMTDGFDNIQISL